MVTKDMSFADFCNKMCASLDDEEMVTVLDGEYINPVFIPIAKAIIKELKPKMKKLDRLKVSYIVKFFEQYEDNIDDIIHNNTDEDDIPDELINYLADQLYNMKYNDMARSCKNIINVLAIYIYLQI